jgi:diacylglycerol kinase family enzyme
MPLDQRPVVVILNAAAGKRGAREELRARLEERFRAAGRAAEVRLVEDGGAVGRAAREAVEGGAGAVVVGGGDGTISTAAHHLVGTDVTLGVVPLGTLNHFAKDLGLPLDPEQAAAVVLEGRTAAVDVGEVNGRPFLNNSSVGLYPRIVRMRQRYDVRGLLKWVVAGWATLRALNKRAAIGVRLDADGEKVLRRTPLVFIGNNEYRMEGLGAPKRESLFDGHLAVYVVRASSAKLPMLRLLWRVFAGKAEERGDLEVLRAEAATIETRRPTVLVALDGEVERMRTPLEYRVRPGALRVFVPLEGAAGRAGSLQAVSD